MIPPAQPPRRAGVALILVLWAITLLSMTVIGVVFLVSDDLEDDGAAAREFRGRLLAESGLAIAMHPSIRRYDPLLTNALSSIEGFEVKLNKEAGRFNINRLLANQTGRDTLLRLFDLWGVDYEDANTLVDVLVDWTDADDVKQLNGAESRDYEAAGRVGDPPNAPFRSIEELNQVPGWDAVVLARPDWRQAFTLWGDGKLDLTEARSDLIAAACDVTLETALLFIRARGGTEDEPPSLDDLLIRDNGSAAAALGMSQSNFQKLLNRVTLSSNLLRIESTGYVGRTRKTIIVVATRGGGAPAYLDWTEP